jgi:ElaB/YqjD/DUF883 family membrane-anchored ribosome-binding protein
MSTEELEVTVPPEVETKAKSLGWAPKEEWRGDPEHWIDAQTFLRRGEEVLPILKENNKRLQSTVEELRSKLNAATESIEELKKFNSEMARERAKEMRQELIDGIAKAREEGDVKGEIELTEKLAETRQAIADSSVPTPPPKQIDYENDPNWIATKEAYPWWGTDGRRTALAISIGSELRQAGDTSVGKDFFFKVAAEVESMLGGSRRESPSRVGSGRGTGGGNTITEGHTFADLPADAKEACRRQAARVVGKGRAFPDESAWQKHYTKLYFGE